MAPFFLGDNLRTRRPGVRIPHGVPPRNRCTATASGFSYAFWGWGKNADVFQMSFRQLASLSAIPCLRAAKPNLCLSSAAVTQALSSSACGAASAPMRCCRQVPVAAGTLIGFKRAHFAPAYFLRSYLQRNTNLAIIEKTWEVRACIRESWKRARPWCRFCRASASGRACSIRMRTKYP